MPERILLVGGLAQLKPAALKKLLPQKLTEVVVPALEARPEPLKEGQSTLIPPLEKSFPQIYIAALPKGQSSFDLLTFARDQLKSALSESTRAFALLILESKFEKELAEAFAAAMAVRTFRMPVYGKKAKEGKNFQLKDLWIFSAKDISREWRYGMETGHGTNLVRQLGFTPSNYLSAKTYGLEIERLAKKHGLTLKFYSNAALKKMGAGAFTAVDQGNPESKGGIYELTYSARGAKNKQPVVLVGKGLCFDTGGYDIKTGGYMVNMKGDMQGSAVALSTICTAARLKLPVKMKAFLGVTENHISPRAYKADDVIIALNGTSIEVVNTDAEGRMVLADTLTLASRAKPHLMIDFATLTGAAVYSIGTNYSAGFTNQEKLHAKIVEAGRTSGERVWTFPMDADYAKKLETPIADTLQCSRSRGGDHILAAIFLSRFLEGEFPWVHIDLSAAENQGGLGHVDTTYTGFGVRWALEFIRSQFRLSKAA